jgi:PAS domain S-box-containing protein
MKDSQEFLRELRRLRENGRLDRLPGGFLEDLEAFVDVAAEFQNAQDHSPAGQLVVNRKGGIMRANLTARHLFRHFHGPVTGRRLFDFFPADRREALFLHLRHLRKTGQPDRLELPLLETRERNEGRTWVRLDSQTEIPRGQAEEFITVVLTDVTEEHQLTEALRTERARFRTLLEQMPAGVVIAEASTGRVTLHNRMAGQLMGGLPPMNRFEDYERLEIRRPNGQRYRWWEYPMARAIREEESIQQEEVYGRFGEREIIFSVSAGPVRGEDGKIVAGALSFQDITARKKADRVQAMLAAIFNSSEDAIIRKELDGTITHWNSAAERIYGYSAAEMIGQHAGILVPEALRGEEVRLISHVARGEKIRAMETVRLGRNGRRIDISLTMNLILGENRRPEAVSSIERDVTERKKLDLELLTSRRQLEMATTAGDVGIWTYDLRADHCFWNAQLYAMLGLQPRRGPEAGDAFMKFIHPEDRKGSLESLDRVIQEHTHFSLEFRIVRADGKVRWLIGKGRVERDENGVPVSMRGINIDVTDRRMAEMALEASQAELTEKVKMLERSNQELSEFAYAISHDLKAPFRAVRNYANFLEMDLGDTLDEEAAGYLRGMKKAIAQGDQLICDLLDFSRIRKNADSKESIDLPALVGEIAHVLDSGPDVEISLPKKAPPIFAERSLLKRALMNLASNGLKFNESEIRRVEISADALPGQRVRIRVRDNGIGIAPEYHGQVFRIFQRLHGPSEYEGTGIGLAIVKKAVLAMGGAVRLESAPGRGSAFILDVPNDPSDSEIPPPGNESPG